MAKYKLSRQEQQVLILTMAGRQDREIAEELGIKLDTVRVYWKRIRAKTERATRAEVIALMASESKHIELEETQKQNELLLAEMVRRRGLEDELTIYREVFSRTCVGLAVDAGEGAGIIRLNEAFADLHGYQQEELLGRPFDMLLAPPDKRLAAKIEEKADRLGEVLLTERHLRKDKSFFRALKQVTSISSGNRVQFRIYTIVDLDQAKTWQELLAD